MLNGTICEALNHENAAKVRDYYWFKDYILNSNIWFELDEAAITEQKRNITEEERKMTSLVPFGQKKLRYSNALILLSIMNFRISKLSCLQS